MAVGDLNLGQTFVLRRNSSSYVNVYQPTVILKVCPVLSSLSESDVLLAVNPDTIENDY